MSLFTLFSALLWTQLSESQVCREREREREREGEGEGERCGEGSGEKERAGGEPGGGLQRRTDTHKPGTNWSVTHSDPVLKTYFSMICKIHLLGISVLYK